MSGLAPDRVGVEVGFRAWGVQDVDGQPRLASVIRPDVWQPRHVLEATCDRSSHAPPSSDCTCGVYAAASLAQLQQQHYGDFGDDDTIVVGEVALWGTVIAATQGWRGQYAYPRTLVVPWERWQYLAPLRSAYGVPAVLANTLTTGRS